MRTVIGPCLACGDACDDGRVYSGCVGPFCSVRCRNKQDDRKLWERANAYALRIFEVTESVACGGAQFQESDIARAFVIGYAAGLEAGQSDVGRRTVKR